MRISNSLLIICGAIFLANCGSDSNNPSNVLEKFDSPLDSLNALIQSDAGDEEALRSRAEYYYNNGDYEMAMDDLNQKMAISSTDEDYYMKGNILFSNLQIKGNADNANKAYRLCVQENSQNANCYVKLAQIQQLLDNYDESISLVDSALMIDQTLPDAYFLKGLTFELRRAKGDTSLAISSYQTAIEVNPDFYEAYMRLGSLHAAQKSMLTEQYYGSAINTQPNRIEAHYNLAIFYQDNGMFTEAMEKYDDILAIDPNSYLAYHNQGYILLVYGDKYAEASEKLSLSIENNPEYTEAYHNRGLAYKNLGKYELAREDFLKALELRPDFTLSALQLEELDEL